MKTLVLDDKFLAVDDLIVALQRIDPGGVHLGFTSADEALVAIEEQPDIEVAFLDIDLPRTNGIRFAERVQKVRPKMNIIFVTGHPDYAVAAHEMYVSGFLVKPVSQERLKRALENLRFPAKERTAAPQGKRIRIQALGNFEVFVDGNPLEFKRNRAKELLAYLVDRRGAMCTNGELLAILWEDQEPTQSAKSYLRALIKELRDLFEEKGLGDFVVRGRNATAINTDMADCDYYRLLDESGGAIEGYRGEYMTQYSWSEYSEIW